MIRLLKWAALPAVLVAGLFLASPQEADAGGFSFSFSTGSPYYGYYGGGPSYYSRYYSYSPYSYGSYGYSNYGYRSSYYAPRSYYRHHHHHHCR